MNTSIIPELIKTIESIDINPILECYHSIEPQISWTDYNHKGKQAGLQYLDNEDPWDSAVGRSRGKELEYSNLNPLFSGTIFEEIINKYKFRRTRLMWVGPYACYSMHKDSTPRVHIPLITNSECYFVFKSGIIKNLESGQVHYTDTRFFHTFMNCSDQYRLHLVGAVENLDQ
jgi:hypothetical protein